MRAPELPEPAGGRLRRVARVACFATVGAQLVGLLVWSAHIAAQASLTSDFATYYQAWFQIAHGTLAARDTLHGGLYFFQNDGEFVVYLLAPLYWIFPDHVVGFLWLQDLAIAGSGVVLLRWVMQLVPWRGGDPRRAQLVAATCWLLATCFLVLNPWVYWVATFDVHMEPFAVLSCLLGTRALIARRRIAALWLALALSCGAPAALYVLGAGLTALVVLWWNGRRGTDGPLGSLLAAAGGQARAGGSAAAGGLRRRLAAPGATAVLAACWVVFLDTIHATNGSVSQGYAYLVNGASPSAHPSTARVLLGVLQHPGEVASVLATHGWNFWANLSPDGLLGILSPPGFLMTVPTLFSENLFKFQAFSYPSFQSFVVYCFVALGSVTVLAFLLRRRWGWLVGAALVAAMLANLAGWFVTFFPQTPGHFVLITPQGGALVDRIAAETPAGDEAVVSQGLVGVFAGRSTVYAFDGPIDVPLRARTVVFVLSPDQGAESATPDQTIEAITAVRELPGVQQISGGELGIYAYRWHAPAGMSSLALAEPGAHQPAWNALASAGMPVLDGPASTWHAAAKGTSGDVVANDYFTESPGRYVARVDLDSDIPVTFEVWDVYDHAMIAGSVVEPAGRRITAALPFSVGAPSAPASPAPAPSSIGSGPFRYSSSSYSPPSPVVSIVLWTPGGVGESIYWFSISPAG
ncbi:MAG TPA: hypothetical protein VMD59_00220 [Acidimicrobiales bacterium]|nr:hypothetical protein [Acidimicrobiales bacterium]